MYKDKLIDSVNYFLICQPWVLSRRLLTRHGWVIDILEIRTSLKGKCKEYIVDLNMY